EGDVDYSELIATLSRLQTDGEPEAAPKAAEAAPKAAEAETAEPAAEKPAEPAAKADAPAEPPAPAAPEAPPPKVETPAPPPPKPESAAPKKAGGGGKPPAAKKGADSHSISDSSIRVDVGLLDKLMNLVGELVLARNQVLQHTSQNQDATLNATSQRLNLITTELQEGVMKTRMQPIGNVWSKFPRVVRDLGVACGKTVGIQMEGKGTELDKTIIEAIKDPLTHIVRNAVDHGLESPEDRVAIGKPKEGLLKLRAYHEGGQVNIEISDDGKGIDPEKLLDKAITKSLITSEQAARMNEREILNLIFAPGFSTAEKVTNVSGRGVGMDVVRSNIEKIGGTVDIQSQVGRGTTLKIKIPLTLAIIPALVVTCGDERFALPQVNLLELVRLEGQQARAGIEHVHGVPV
ncbi:MAG: chemotaxis protein CheA, partial [Myxococcota bacterium]